MMNFWNLHKSPEQITGYLTRLTIPKIAYQCVHEAILNLSSIAIAEKTIAKDSYFSFLYARDVIRGKFELGEKAIAKSYQYALWYARNVLHGRFPTGEGVIATNAQYSYWYARHIIRGRFPAGEKAINKNITYREDYKKFIASLKQL